MSQAVERRWYYELDAEFGHVDITPDVESLVSSSGVTTGSVTLGLVGSTGGLTTIEYETGALNDLRRACELLAPADQEYHHNERWHDGNGFSHVRSALLRTTLCIPVIGGKPALGTWQQIVAINFDNRPRRREVVGVVAGS